MGDQVKDVSTILEAGDWFGLEMQMGTSAVYSHCAGKSTRKDELTQGATLRNRPKRRRT